MKLDESLRPCATPWSEWEPTFAVGSLEIVSVKCCLAPWKKCVAAESPVAASVDLLPDTEVTVAVEIGIGIGIGIGTAETIVAMAAAPATTGEMTIGRATAGTDRVRAAIVAAVRVAVLQSLRHV
tara:strand:+ start:101015 stop:101389 length:375 start_codon:yes stop_codon:yes gene_type:complete